jgi:hypothetical protein
MANGRTAACLLAGLVTVSAGFGQEEQAKRAETPPPRFYRLEFLLKELENDKVVNSRAYATSLSANTREGSSIRAGSRVPYASGIFNPGPGGATTKQYQFYDIGVSIDCRDARELGSGQLTLFLSVDVSNILVTKESSGELPPSVRNTKWSSPVVIPIKKPTTVFSSDDPSGNRKMQLELTATPVTEPRP